MTLNDYQEAAIATAIYPRESAIVYPALGLCGESGEVAEKVKKTLRDNGGEFDRERRTALAKELSDCLWYVSALASDLGYNLQDIADLGLAKLASRAERGVLSGSGDER